MSPFRVLLSYTKGTTRYYPQPKVDSVIKEERKTERGNNSRESSVCMHSLFSATIRMMDVVSTGGDLVSTLVRTNGSGVASSQVEGRGNRVRWSRVKDKGTMGRVRVPGRVQRGDGCRVTRRMYLSLSHSLLAVRASRERLSISCFGPSQQQHRPTPHTVFTLAQRP